MYRANKLTSSDWRWQNICGKFGIIIPWHWKIVKICLNILLELFSPTVTNFSKNPQFFLCKLDLIINFRNKTSAGHVTIKRRIASYTNTRGTECKMLSSLSDHQCIDPRNYNLGRTNQYRMSAKFYSHCFVANYYRVWTIEQNFRRNAWSVSRSTWSSGIHTRYLHNPISMSLSTLRTTYCDQEVRL